MIPTVAGQQAFSSYERAVPLESLVVNRRLDHRPTVHRRSCHHWWLIQHIHSTMQNVRVDFCNSKRHRSRLHMSIPGLASIKIARELGGRAGGNGKLTCLSWEQ